MAGTYKILAALTGLLALTGIGEPVKAQGYEAYDRWQDQRRWGPPSYEPYDDRARPRRRYEVEADPNPGVATEPDVDEPQYEDRRRMVIRRPYIDRRYRERDDDSDAGQTDRRWAPGEFIDERDDTATSDSKPEGVFGGARPTIAPVAPPRVAFSGGYTPGSIVIDTSRRKLYYVTGPTAAYAYPIGVGREGFSWTGSEKVSRIADWPDWYPPAEMRQRKPELPERMLGGLNNPLGAKAIYLGNTLYRIHGTNDPKSIGKAESSGCFRMMNQHVLHLASLVSVGTQVTVVHSLGAPKPVAAVKPAAPKPVAAKPVVAKPTKVAAKPAPVVRKRPSDRYYDDDDRPRYRRRYYDDYYYGDYGGRYR